MKKQILFFLLLQCGLMMHSFAQNVNASSTTGIGGTYPTLKAAFDDINNGLLSGAVTLTVVDNTIETSTAVLSASGGSAGYTSVIISPSGGAWTITGNMAGGPVIDLNGADNVKIDGLNTGGNALTIINTATTNTVGTSTIRFINDATADTITNCTVLGSATSSAATASGTILFHTTTGTTGNDNNAITFCQIGPAGSNLPSKAIHSLGTTTSVGAYNNGITIDHCHIYDYFMTSGISAGMWLGNANGSWTVSNNKFYQTGARTQVTTGGIHAAVYVSGGNGSSNSGHAINNNTIGYANANGSGMYSVAGTTSTQVIGIYFASVGTSAVATASVQGNTITNIAVSGNVSGTGQGSPFIGISAATGVAISIGTIIPNTIGSQTATGAITMTSSATGAGEALGIYAGSSANSTVSNNLIGGIGVSNTGTGAANVTGIKSGTTTSISLVVSGNTIGGTVANSMQSTTTANGTQVIGLFLNGPSSTITGNTIRNLTAGGGTGILTGASVSGIVLSVTSSNHTVTQNTIHSLSNTNANIATVINGIYYSSGTGTNTVSRNNIHSFSTASNTAVQHGIYINQGTATYSNNIVRLGIDATGADVSTGTVINGIYENNGTNNLYYNSIYIGGANVGGSANTYAFQSMVTTNPRNYINNSFYNARSNGAGTGKHYAIKIAGTTVSPAGLSMNNNLMFISGSGGVFGFYNSADVPDLISWATAVGLNTASWSTDPMYALPNGSAALVDLAPMAGSPLLSSGTPIAAVTIDITGMTRSTVNPSIGAGESTTSLPVKWVRFTGKKQSEGVLLTWVTAGEINNNYFMVQRSEDGQTFTNIAKVKGKGTTTSTSTYTYSDGMLPTGVSTLYYRLVQVDHDQKTETSAVVVVATAKQGQENVNVQVAPNPFTDVTSVHVHTDKPGAATLKIVDMQGKEIVKRNVELQQGMNQFNIDELSSDAFFGIYFVTITTSSESYTQRLVKNR